MATKSAPTPQTTSSPTTSRKPVANPTYAVLPKQAYYGSFQDFYPFYLGEHAHPVNRRLHLLGTSISSVLLTRVSLSLLSTLTTALTLIAVPEHATPAPHTLAARLRSFALNVEESLGLSNKQRLGMAVGAIVQGYAFAWVGHFMFERNKPATFTHPGYSFIGDLKMAWEVWTLQRKP